MANNTSLVFTLLGKDKLSSTMGKAGKNAGSFGSTLAAVGKVGAAGLVAVGTALGGVSVKAAGFDKTIRKVGAIAGVTGKDLDGLSKLALKMGEDTVFSASEAADAMLELAKGGFTRAQIEAGALQGALTLATAGELSMAGAATFLGNTLNTFGLKAKDSNRVVAALAGGANASSASVESLGMALSQVGPGAKLAGASIEETVAVLAAFDNAGIKGSDAGTSLKTMFMRLVPQTDKAAGAMKKLGVDFTDSHGAILPLRDIAEQLQTKLKGLTTEQKQAALTTIFGSDAYRAAAVMAELGAKGVDKYTKSTSDLKAAQKLAKVGVEGAAGALEQFKGSVETLVIQLGMHLLPAFTDLLNFMTRSVLPGVGDLIETFAGFGEKVTPKVKAAFQTIRETVAGALEGIDLSGVGTSFTDAAKGWAGSIIGGVQTGMDSGDWKPLGKSIGTGIAKAISGIGSTIGKLTKAFLDVLGKVDWIGIGIGLGKQAPSLLVGIALGILNFDIGALLSGLADHWQEALFAVLVIAFAPAKFLGFIAKTLAKIPFVGSLLKWGFDAFAGFSKGLVGAVGRFLDDVFVKTLMPGLRTRIISIAKGFSQWMGELPTRLGIIAINLRQKAVEMMAGLRASIVDRISSIVVGIKDLIAKMLAPFAKAGTWLVNRGRDFVVGLKNGVVNAATGIGTWVFQRVIQPLTSRFLSAASWLLNRGREFVGGLKSGIVDAATAIGSWVFQRVIQPVTSRFSRAHTWLVNSGKNILGGLKSGIVDSMKGIASWVKTRIVDPVVKAVKKYFGIKSPSTVFSGIGANLVGGLLKGMGSKIGGAIARKVFGDMPNALGAIVSKGLISVKNLPSKALKALSGLGGKFGDLFGGLGGEGRAPGNVSGNAAVVQTAAAQRGWATGAQWNALHKLIMGESGFRNTAQNPTSSAYGMFQFLDSTWAGVGGHKTSDPWLQSTFGLRYISQVYGNPLNAYNQWLSRSPHWYEKGSFSVPQTGPAVVHRGEMILPDRFASAVRASLAGGGDDGRVEEILHRIMVAVEAALDAGDAQVVLDTGVIAGEVTRRQRAGARSERVAAGTAGWSS